LYIIFYIYNILFYLKIKLNYNLNINISIINIQMTEQEVKKKKLIYEEDVLPVHSLSTQIINKGTGAGGSNTNLYGKLFEEQTNNEIRLIHQGFIKIVTNNKTKFGYHLIKTFEDKKVIFVSQSGFKEYIKTVYNIELFRCPDEAYIFEYTNGKRIIKILEKKEQNVQGSVDTKLLAGPAFKEEYFESLEGIFDIEYAFCVSKFLQDKIQSQDKKYIIFNKIMKRHNISILFGNDDDYFQKFEIWLNLS